VPSGVSRGHSSPIDRDEGPNFVLRTGRFAVQEAGVIEVRAGMYGADAEDAGRNPEEAG
jgi:hypothetical protein